MAYCTVQDIRAEGITIEQAPDDRLQMLIDLATRYIDKITGWWFEPRQTTLLLDGTGKPELLLPIFPITIDTVYINNIPLRTEEYIVYNRLVPDDRYNPKIVRRGFAVYPPPPWTDGCMQPVWLRGRQNIKVVGTFGFCDQDEQGNWITPPLIKDVCKRLVIRDLPSLGQDSEARKRSYIVSESTEGHSYSLSKLATSGGLTGDPAIDEVLRHYTRTRWAVA